MRQDRAFRNEAHEQEFSKGLMGAGLNEAAYPN
jgi:hypothetical protein